MFGPADPMLDWYDGAISATHAGDNGGHLMPWTALAAEESVIDPSLLLPSYGPSDVTPAPAPWPDARPSSGSRQARPTGHKIRDTAHAPRYFQFHSITGVVADLMVDHTMTTRLSLR